jgi:hypothetical protein
MGKLCLALVAVLLIGAMAHAEVKVIVKGESVSIDTTGFPPKMQKAYVLMQQKCNQCHSIERIVAAVQTGICPLSKETFTKKTTRSLVTRMYLKPGANMTKDEARTIVILLNYLLDQKVTVVEKQ